ncbi:hypothetical protein EC973_003979 [Apophysomyces ossiformis]|uniref:Uncharacterized protein n=1 Tax=Apophysomyces ossiformis TaxID=679940 RepID=A0A8H7BL22_9FUNG|nr:hypothetical protein EC973_003979 [Apophysomyces ossiformis]
MGNKHRLFSRSNFVSPTPEKSCNKPSPLSAPPSVKRLIPSLSTFNLPPCHPITPFDSGRSIDNPPPVFACDELNIPKGHFVLSDLPTGSGIRPIQLLLERLDAWHTLARRLYEYFQMLAQVEAQVAKAYHRLDGLLAFSGEKQNGKHPLLYTHFAVQDRGHTGIQLVCDSWQAYYSDNAKDHDEFGNFLRTHALPTLSNIKRELKWMTRTIRSDDRLTLSTLAKLRDEASKRIQRLDAQLSFFDQHPHHVYTKQDPWIINAAVIKQIIKVYQQENKIHETVLRLQHETRVSEEHLMEELQQLFRQIYSMREHNILGLDKGIQRMMDVFEQAKPGADWQSFAERAKGHLISENAAFRHPDQLHYPNQSHPLLQPLFAARMERKSTVLHQWHEYMYVLTPASWVPA